MQVIQVKKEAFDRNFQTTLDKLSLISLKEGTIDVKLNSQQEVINFIDGLHRSFHYEVCILKERLEK